MFSVIPTVSMFVESYSVMLRDMRPPPVFFTFSAKDLPGMACTTEKMLNELISCRMFPLYWVGWWKGSRKGNDTYGIMLIYSVYT